MIVIGSDHGGFHLKETVIEHLENRGFEVLDVGTHDTESTDYPVFADKVVEKVLNKEAKLGVLICGTGIGMSMAANKHKGIRCAVCSDVFSAKATKEHNNANILAMGERVLGPGLALEIVDAFVDTPFSDGERHINRINLFDK